MENELQEIKGLKGVKGVFVFSSKVGVLGSDLSEEYPEAAILQIGEFIKKVLSHHESAKLAVNDLEIKFDEILMVTKELADSTTLVTLCEPGADISQVNMTTSMLALQLQIAAEKMVKESKGVSPAKETQSTSEPVPAATEKVDVNKLMSSGPFSKIANRLQDAMTEAIGPVGGMVVGDCVEKWVENGPPSKSRMKELVDLLLKEIGDARLEKEFSSSISDLL